MFGPGLAFALGLVAQTLASPVARPGSMTMATATTSAPAAVMAAKGAAQTLLPAVHWAHPVNDLRNLDPTNSSDLYYAAGGIADPSVKHQFAAMSTTFQYETVVLNHSSYINSVSCSPKGIKIDFSGPQGFNYAMKAWPGNGQDFVLVTSTDGCGNSTDKRTFWLIDSISGQKSSNSIVAKVKQEIATENAMSDVDMIWGTYHPPTAANGTVEKRGVDIAKRIEKEVTKTATIDVAAPTDTVGPFGPAASIFSGKIATLPGEKTAEADVSLECVDCFFKSEMVMIGHAKFKFFGGLEILTAEMDANVLASLQLGMTATGSFTQAKKINLFTQSIPDLSIEVPEIFFAGLTVSVDAEAKMTLSAATETLLGVNMTLPDFKAFIDLQDDGDKTKNSNFSGNPVFGHTFQANGSFSATAELGLPLSLSLGVMVPKIDFDRSISLIDEPAMEATITVAGAAGNGSEASTDIENCKTAGLEIKAVNDVKLNLFNLKVISLAELESPPLAEVCLIN